MNKIVHLILIVGFLFVDFLFFHDAFKAGEVISAAQYLTGALSVLVFINSGLSLAKK
jgi:hypothetical protein